MKKNILITLLAALLLSSCGEYNKLLKSTDYEYKYEAAKNYFAKTIDLRQKMRHIMIPEVIL